MVKVRLVGQNNRSVCSVTVRRLSEGQAPRSRLGSSVEVSRIGHSQAQSLNPNSSNNYFTFKTFSTVAIYTPHRYFALQLLLPVKYVHCPL